MKRLQQALIFLAGLVAALGWLLINHAPAGQIAPPPAFVPGHVLVKYKAGAQIEAGSEIAPLGIHVVQAYTAASEDPREATLRMLNTLRESEDVAWAELDYIASIQATPNDRYVSRQWALRQVDAFAAWDTEWGAEGVVIAVVDTGVDRTHPDLAGKLVAGHDYVNNDDDPQDDHGHGTHVAGIAAAIANNGRGVAGLCPGCSIMPVKVLSDSGSGSYSNVARGITYAAGNGAKVINLSLGGPARSQTLEDAVVFARKQGALVVAAAGNAGTSTPQYPAAIAGVMAVAATTPQDRRASFSSFGRYVAAAAPGTNILSTCTGGRYCEMSGTSMSSPLVAGLAGLVASHWPEATGDEIRRRIEAGADPLSEGGLGAGRVNAARSLSGKAPTPAPTRRATRTPLPRPTSTPAGDDEAQTAQLINEWRQANGLPALHIDQRLVEASRVQSADMEQNGYCGHFGSDGSDPYSRMRDAGYNWPYGEIVACGYRTPAEAVEGWKASPGHNAIMLCQVCQDFGAGVVGSHYTVDFGRGDPSRPTPPPMVTRTPRPPATATPAGGFWMWCKGNPLRCQEAQP